MDETDLPLLGEPLPVELANTLYRDGQEWIEVLADSPAADLWLRATAPRFGVDGVPATEAADVVALRALRDAVRELIEASLVGRTAADVAVQTVNVEARRAPRYRELAWPAGADPSARTAHAGGDDLGAVFTTLAEQAIDLVSGPGRHRLRRCEAPGCAMYFVKDHPRRSWCNPSCGHRARQARYYRRQRAQAAGTG